MRKTEAFDIIAEFSEKITSSDDFNYEEIGIVLHKATEALKKYPDLSKYVDSEFIAHLKSNYISDFSLEYTRLFMQIMRSKNTEQQRSYLQKIKGLNSNLRKDFENYAAEENPELIEDIFAERLLRLKNEPVSPNNNFDVMSLIAASPTAEMCEKLLRKAFGRQVPESYRNKNIIFISNIYAKYPELIDTAFDVIREHKNSKNYFSALADVACFDEYKTEEVLYNMRARIQNGPVDEYLLQKYYANLKAVSDELPKFKILTQEFCREALLLPQNSKNCKKLAARLLEDEEALYSQTGIGKKVEKNSSNSFGYEKINSVEPSETCILFIGGNGTKDDKAAHGYIKPAIELLKKHNLADRVTVYGTTYDFGDYFNVNQALDEQMKKYGHKTVHRDEELNNMHIETKNPRFIKQIFDQFILPRISMMNGKVKIPVENAARNINKLKIVAHCFGGYAALKLEEMSIETMKKLGYTEKEQNFIQKQLQILAMNPYCPLGVQKSEMFSLTSAQDRDVKHKNFFENYIRKLVAKGKIIPLCYFEQKLGNFVLINRMYGSDNHRNTQIDVDEHNYYGLNIIPTFSEKGKIAMTFAQNFLINGLKSALKDEIRVQNTPELLFSNQKDKDNLIIATENGKKLYQELVEYTLAENNKIFSTKNKRKFD